MKMWKRVMGLALSMILLISAFPVSALAAYAEDDVIVSEGAIEIDLGEDTYSFDDGVFLLGTVPSGIIVKDGITRAEWMKDLTLLFDMSITADEYPDIYFPDISETTTYFDAIMTAIKYGLVDIEAGDNFEPDAVLTREFAAQTLNYCLGMQKTSVSYTYGDIGAVQYRDDAQVAIDLGWFALVGGNFAPAQQVTADEITAMVNSVQTILDERDIGSGTADFQFADYVKVIPDTAEINSTIDFDTEITTVTISKISNWNGSLDAGDTFAFYAEDYAFVYGVDQVVNSDGVIHIITTDAPAGSILNYDYAGELDLELSPDLRNNEPLTLMSADGDEVYFEEIQLLSSSKRSISFSRDFTKGSGIGVKGKISGTVKDLKLDTKFLGGNKHFILSGKIEVTSSMELDLLDDPAAGELQLGGVSLGPFGYAGIEINLKMEAKIGYTLSSEFKLGLDYQRGNVSWIKELNTKDSCLTAEGTVSAQLALAAHLEFGANGSASISLGAGPKLDAKAKKYSAGTPTTCITLAGYLHAGFDVKVKLKEIFTSKVVFNYKYSYDFYNEKNSPIRVYTHVEDGVEVYACTRGNVPGIADSGYKNPKYISPANSKYYAGGSNVSSSGSGGYGTTDPVVIWETSDNGDGTVTITGYKGGASMLNIPEMIDGKMVTQIGDRAFQKNKSIRMVNIADTVTAIGGSAFEGCTNLASVTFSPNLTSIEHSAFRECTSLTSADLPEGLRSLGEGNYAGVFYKCTALQHVYIPASLEIVTYWSGPFSGCSSLDNVTFGPGISSIPANLFEECSGLTHIEIPNTVTEIGHSAFYRCANLASVIFSPNLTSIEHSAFRECTSLTSVDLPEGLRSLGEGNYAGVFYKCTALQHVHIPASLEIVTYWSGPFSGCSSLNDIKFGSGISSIIACLFKECDGLTHIEIPDTVTEIGSSAFYKCKNLVSVTFSQNLTDIDNCAFEECTSLTSVDLPEGLLSLGKGNYSGVFYKCTALQRVNIPASLETVAYWSGPFSGCSSLDSVTFGPDISSIPAYLFKECDGLTHIEIPDTVTEIGSSAFYKCINLASIQIPNSVTTIGSSAFCGSSLATVTIPDTVTKYPNAIFQDCTELTTATLSKTALVIPQGMFSGCTSLKTINLPDGVTEIKSSTFQNCAALENLDFLPVSVTSIGSSAFQGCTSLTSADLPDLVYSLGSSAFKGCTSLTSFKASNDLVTIGANCFQDCTKLTDVDFNEGLTTIGNYAFQNCAALETIVLPDSVTSLGTYMFQQDAKLVNVTLSTGLKEIPSYAFEKCTSMTELVIPKGVTGIGNKAFYQDTNLKTFTIPASVTSIGDNAFSYPTTTTVSGISGSYAQTFAKWMSFTDITKAASGLTLSNGTNAMTIGRSLTVTPRFTFTPSDSTDVVVSLASDNTNIVSVRNNTQLYGNRAGSANITATTFGGRTYMFSVTVDTLSGIEITHVPDTTDFGLKDDKDVTGLVVSAVFANGSKEPIYDYTVSGFTTDVTGTHTITVTYNEKTATFPITVSKMGGGTLGNNDELRWTYSSGSGQVTITGNAVTVSEPVYVAVYDRYGKMTYVTVITASGGKANIGDSFDHAKLIWVDVNETPKCVNAEITASK